MIPKPDVLSLGFHVCPTPSGTCSGCGQEWMQWGPQLFVSAEPGSKMLRLPPPTWTHKPEVDPAWLRAHSSRLLRNAKELAGQLGIGRMMGAAGGSAVGGILAGSTGDGFDPALHQPKTFVVRQAEGQYTYTRVHVAERQGCLRCGWALEEIYEVDVKLNGEDVQRVGRFGVCGKCDHDSFMYVCHMPRTSERRHREEGKMNVGPDPDVDNALTWG